MSYSNVAKELLDWGWSDAVKVIITAFVVVIATKIQVVSDRFSALVIALPLTSLVAMFWMRWEEQELSRIANHAEATFWFVLPTLPMFLLLPWMLRSGWGFGVSMGVNMLITIGLFWALVYLLRRCGLALL